MPSSAMIARPQIVGQSGKHPARPGCTLLTRKPCTEQHCQGCLAGSAMGKTRRIIGGEKRDG